MSDDMPEQPKTKEIPAADPNAIAIAKLTHIVESRFDKTDSDLEFVKNDLESVKNEGQRTGMRLTRVEMRLDDVETRLTRNSGRVKDVSEADLSQAAALAEEKIAREALASKVDAHDTKLDGLDKKQDLQLAILTRLDIITKNPLVKTIAAMLATAFITWLATKGIKVPQ